MTTTNLNRRDMMAGSASGLAIALFLRVGGARAAKGALTEAAGGNASPSLFIELTEQGLVQITCHRSEMGQQVWNAMAQIVADELDADWTQVRVAQADGDTKYGDQNTDGSRSVRNNFHRLRVAGGAMRWMLIEAAAQRWGVAPSLCTTEPSFVVGPERAQKLSYSELSTRAGKLPLPNESQIKLKKRNEWRFIGKSIPSLTIPKIVRGEATFGMDVSLPGMLYAVVARPPQVFGTLKSADSTTTLKVSGVVTAVELPALRAPALFNPLGGIAVVAKNSWAAIQGRKALKLEWEAGPNAGYNSKAFEQELFSEARKKGKVRLARGNANRALGKSATRLSAEYYVPHLAHSSMEPPAATARWDGDKVEVWACVQTPQATQVNIANVCEIPLKNITVHVTLLGGAFGRKSKPDFAAEAALIAREAGAPVKLFWTREDDLQHDFYHTVSAQRLEAGFDDKGACTAWLHRTVFPPIMSTFDGMSTAGEPGDLQQGATDTPFAIPNMQLETGDAKAHVRIGWLRSVANIYHVFAVQSFVAEIAHAQNKDPKDMLLELIGPPRKVDPNRDKSRYDNYGASLSEYPIETGRLAAVVNEVAQMAKWGKKLPKGEGMGIAAHRSFLSYVATVVHVKVAAGGALTILGVWSAMDAGTVVNPDHAASQLEGGTLFGLSNALYGEISAKDGAIIQSNFPDWRVMRMNESPRAMKTKIMEVDAPPGGVGEAPTPLAAPALASAIFAASGQRIRRLPIVGAKRGGAIVQTQPESQS